ncbi:MAG: TIR domain-containing protein, partial [Chloroflexi bacterium]
MADVFISYSRKDTDFVRKLYNELTAAGREVWVDWKDIPPSADWWAEIENGIDDSHNFAFVISPDSVISEVCGQELEYANTRNKRLVPIIHRHVETGLVPDCLTHLNWMFFDDDANFHTAVEELNTVLDTDLEWVKAHTRLTTRTTEWLKANRNESYMLRGDDLADALQRLTQVDKEPKFTQLQVEYILASRERAQRVQSRTLIAVSFGLVIVSILAVMAYLNFRTAEEQRVQAQNAQSTAVSERDRAATAEGVAVIERDRAATAEVVAEEGRKNAESARATAEAERAEAERRSQISLAQSLAALALPIVERTNNTEQAALLAVEAEYLNRTNRGSAHALIDNSLRTLLGNPYFNVVLNNYDFGVTSVAFSPDGQTVVSAYDDGTIQMQNVNDPTAPPAILGRHDSRAASVRFSPNGSLLVSAGDDGLVRLWNLADPGSEPLLFAGHEGPVITAVFSPSGKTVVSSSDDRTIRLWNISDPDAKPEVVEIPDIALTLAFSPNGRQLAAAGSDGLIRLWDTDDLAAEPETLSGHGSSIRALVFSPNGDRLASASADRTIGLWDVTNPDAKPIFLVGHENGVRSLAFSPNGQTLASGSFDETIRLWNMENLGPATAVLRGHADRIESLAFSPDGQQLVSASADRTLRLWNLGVPVAQPQTRTGHDDWVETVAFSPTGDWLASGSDDWTIRLW